VLTPVPAAAPYGYHRQPGHDAWMGLRHRRMPGAWVGPCSLVATGAPERRYERRDRERDRRDSDPRGAWS
jgi:hypothetical protein